jgi:hypothetical protein
MAGKITDAGGQRFLSILFGTTAKDTEFVLQLFTDSVAVADSNTTSTHTIPTGQAGYEDKTLANDATISTTAGGVPVATWGAQTFTFTGALTGNASIKGYQIKTGTTLLAAELLPSAFLPANNGDTLIITPSMILGNGSPL